MKHPLDNQTQDWLEVTMPLEVAQAALDAMNKVFMDWDVLNEKPPEFLKHRQNLGYYVERVGGCGVSKSIAIFNRTMRLLEAFSKAEKALNTEDISKLINQTQRSAQRTARQLHESGWLECKVYNNCALYSASEKTKKLFGGAK